MYEILKSDQFDRWLRQLRDPIGRANIYSRLAAAERGQWGDIGSIGEGVFEMRVHVGPGYRIYGKRVGAMVYFLLAGGDKSTQQRDIRLALEIARDL